MPHAIRLHEHGGPEQLKWEEVSVGDPGAGEVRIRQTAVGLNFIDIYQRTGLYKFPSLPVVLGQEGAGVVEAVGPGVTSLKIGDRVAYAGMPMGAYSDVRLYPADRLVVVPDGVTDQQAAAIMLQGMTTQYLVKRTYPLKAGETILLHAAAGGVGLLFCQWAKHLGVTVIGTVSTEEKAELARAHGCAHTLVLGRDDIVARVKEITNGKGVPVAYDSVGKDTYLASFDSLAPRGLFVAFGQSSGAIPPIDVNAMLSNKGSLYMTRPTLGTYVATREELVATANDLFDVVKKGVVKVAINQTFPLKDAGAAHIAMESRKTTGSTVLLP